MTIEPEESDTSQIQSDLVLLEKYLNVSNIRESWGVSGACKV